MISKNLFQNPDTADLNVNQREMKVFRSRKDIVEAVK